MIDTVKIVVPFDTRPNWLYTRNSTRRDTNTGLFRISLYPSNASKKEGIYQPRLMYIERPVSGYRLSCELVIEVSLPKLYYGNNFNELTDDLFSAVAIKLSETLNTAYDIWIEPSVIERAEVRRIDYSKNIIFDDFTPISSIVSVMKSADISKIYDFQNTDYKNGGHIYHIHLNTMDIVLYDKIADLKQAMVSEKRSYEKGNYTQLHIARQLEERRNITVARFEIRLNNKSRIKQELNNAGINADLKFATLFSTNTSSKILLRHWQNILDRIPEVATVADTAEQLLISLKQANPTMKFSEASSLTVISLLRRDAKDERSVRNIIEGLFGRIQYYRLKKRSYRPASQTQLKTLLHIKNVIMTMEPVMVVRS